VTALKLKPKLFPPFTPAAATTRTTCSAVLAALASSEVVAFRPPYSAPAPTVNPAPLAALAVA
jgi:hypothetical protein